MNCARSEKIPICFFLPIMEAIIGISVSVVVKTGMSTASASSLWKPARNPQQVVIAWQPSFSSSLAALQNAFRRISSASLGILSP